MHLKIIGRNEALPAFRGRNEVVIRPCTVETLVVEDYYEGPDWAEGVEISCKDKLAVHLNAGFGEFYYTGAGILIENRGAAKPLGQAKLCETSLALPCPIEKIVEYLCTRFHATV